MVDKKYANNAEKQRAYRLRKKVQRQQVVLQQQGNNGGNQENIYILDLPKKERIQYYVDHKVSPTLAKQIEELLSGKKSDLERTPYSHYHEDISLFKTHYCGKDLIPFQERILIRIQEAIKNARARGLDQVIIVVLVPKRYGKTEGIVQPFMLHYIVHNKEDSIKYVGETQELAIQKIAPIRELLADPKARIQDYGPFKTSDWSKTRFTIQRNKYKPDPTLMAWGIFSQKMGQNSDAQFIDDPANADMSFDVVKRVHDAIAGEILNTRNPRCITIMIATRKGPEDIPAMFLNAECPFCDHSHVGNVIIIDEFRQAITKGDYKNPCGRIIQDPEGNILEREVLRPQEDTYWLVVERSKEGRETIIDIIIKGEYQTLATERFTVKQLIMMYWQIGEQAYDRDFQNDPTAMGGNVFKVKWLTGEEHPFKCFYEDGEYDTTRTNMKVITVDLAHSEMPEADYTAMIGAYYDYGYAEYFQDWEDTQRIPLHDVFLLVEEHADRFQPDFIIVEAIGFYHHVIEGWQAASKHRIVFIEKKLVGKKERIGANMQPMYQNAKYHIKRSHRMTIKEYKDFPYSKHEHILDAQEQMVSYIGMSGGGKPGVFVG